MKKTNYGKVRYIDSYVDAPENAEYILRQLTDDSSVLEKYVNGDAIAIELATFPFDAYYKETFFDTLVECRKVINCSKIIWVEKPYWWERRSSKYC